MKTNIEQWIKSNPYQVIGRDRKGATINYYSGTHKDCESWIRSEAGYFEKLHKVSISVEPTTDEDIKARFN